MWLDSDGVLSASVPDHAERYFSEQLWNELLDLRLANLRIVADDVFSLEMEIFEAYEAFVEDPDISYENVELNRACLFFSEDGDTSTSLIHQIRQSDLRWRYDRFLVANFVLGVMLSRRTSLTLYRVARALKSLESYFVPPLPER